MTGKKSCDKTFVDTMFKLEVKVGKYFMLDFSENI